MTVYVAPKTGDAVEIAIALAVNQVHPLSARDHERIRLEPDLHRRKRMPEVLLIEPTEFFGGSLGHRGKILGRPGIVFIS